MRSDILAETGAWRDSAVLDGSDAPEPVATLKRLLSGALLGNYNVYIFGRVYVEGNGVHDIHLNQGSYGEFVHRPGDDRNDHNDVWQDGALMVDLGDGRWAAYFCAFNKQHVPTDNLGNPVEGGETI
jgi:uncharacterized protein YukJ